MEGRLILLSIGILGLAATGCTGGDETPAKTDEPAATASVFTGTLEGTDARVAAVATDKHARLYFCGGDTSYETLSRWVPADIGKSGDLTADETAAMGWSLRAALREGILSGSVETGDGGSYPFEAKIVDGRTIAGLYEGLSPCGKVGVIVSQDSSKDDPVAQGACIGSGTTIDIHQVNPVAPLARDSKGAIRVTIEGSPNEVKVTAAAVPAN
jgi:hypothetical protein